MTTLSPNRVGRTALGDVQLRQNLEARDHLAAEAVARRLDVAELRRLQQAVDAEPDADPVRQRLDVHVAAALLDGQREQLLDDDVSALVFVAVVVLGAGIICVFVELQVHHTRFRCGADATRLRLQCVGVQTAECCLDRFVRRRDDADTEAGQPLQFADDGLVRRIVHADRQALADRADRQQAVTTRVGVIDGAAKRRVDAHALQIDKWHVELRAQRLTHHVVADETQLHQQAAKPYALVMFLLTQRVLQLILRDRAGLDQHLAQRHPLRRGWREMDVGLLLGVGRGR